MGASEKGAWSLGLGSDTPLQFEMFCYVHILPL